MNYGARYGIHDPEDFFPNMGSKIKDLPDDEKKQISLGAKIVNAFMGPGAEDMSKSEKAVTFIKAALAGGAAALNSHYGLPSGPGMLPALQAYTAQHAQEQPLQDFQKHVKGMIAGGQLNPLQIADYLSGQKIREDPARAAAAKEGVYRARDEWRESRRPPEDRWMPTGPNEETHQLFDPDSRKWEVETDKDGKPVTRQIRSGSATKPPSPLDRGKKIADLKAKIRSNVLDEWGIIDANGVLMSLTTGKAAQLTAEQMSELNGEVQKRLIVSLPQAPDSVIDRIEKRLVRGGLSRSDPNFVSKLADEIVNEGYSP